MIWIIVALVLAFIVTLPLRVLAFQLEQEANRLAAQEYRERRERERREEKMDGDGQA
jgi:hypothetical protein